MERKSITTNNLPQTAIKLPLPKWVYVLPILDGRSIVVISRVSRVTYSHVQQYTKRFEKLGWITLVKEGRMVIAHFTKEGKEMAEFCQEMLSRMEVENE